MNIVIPSFSNSQTLVAQYVRSILRLNCFILLAQVRSDYLSGVPRLFAPVAINFNIYTQQAPLTSSLDNFQAD